MAITKIPTVTAKKPAPKPIAPVRVASDIASAVGAKPATPAIVQQAGPSVPPDIMKRLTALENELKAEKERNVALQEKLAKRNEDKNAWREKIYSIQDVEQMAQGKGDSPLAGDWREPYNETFQMMFTYELDKDNNVVPRPDLPARQCLCIVPSSNIPVEPGESAQYNRINRLSGFMCFWDDFSYDDAGQINGVRGVPHHVPGASFVALIVPPEEEETQAESAPEEAEATPEPPPPVAPAKPGKAPKAK
jgi:hypothetical protein